MLPKTEDFHAVPNTLRGLTDKAKVKPVLHWLLSEARPQMPYPERRDIVDKIAKREQSTYCVGVKIRHEAKHTWYEVALYYLQPIKSQKTLDLLKMMAGAPRCTRVSSHPLEITPENLAIVTDLRKYSSTHDYIRELALVELYRRNHLPGEEKCYG